MLTTWLITALTLPMAAPRKRGSSKHAVLSMKMFPLLLVGVTRAFSSSGSGKLLNNRSSEAVGSLWHLSPITAEPPFPCHRPDQLVFYIYDPLSVVTPVEHWSPDAWPPPHQHWGFPSERDNSSVPAALTTKLYVFFIIIIRLSRGDVLWYSLYPNVYVRKISLAPAITSDLLTKVDTYMHHH